MTAYPRMARIFPAGLALLLATCVVEGGGSTGPNGGDEPSGSPPARPSIKQLVPIVQEPDRGMHLIISDASDDEDGFVVQRRTQGGTFTQLGDLAPNTETYDDWGLEVSTAYTYRIRAYNRFGNSNWSVEKTQTAAGPEPGIVFMYPVADAFVQENSPTSNKGTSLNLIVAIWQGTRAEAYLRFPYEEIPSYALDIDAAELRLISYDVAGLGTPLIYVEDLASDWNELNVTWNNRPFGRGVTADGQYVYNNGEPVYWDITSIVRSWFEGATLNRGIRLFAFTEGEAVLRSRENSCWRRVKIAHIRRPRIAHWAFDPDRWRPEVS